MTTDELRNKMNNDFGLSEWPKYMYVDSETYANVCQNIFDTKADNISFTSGERFIKIVKISLGVHHGILFKNVELLIK